MKKAAEKKVAKKMTATRHGNKKIAPKKKVAKKKAAKKKITGNYSKNPGGKILLQDTKFKSHEGVVPVSKLKAGLKNAKAEIQDLTEELSDFADGFNLSELSLSVSFNAEGKFMGIGVGGETSIQIKLTPNEE